MLDELDTGFRIPHENAVESVPQSLPHFPQMI